jgi:hypothetical protein
MFVSANFIADEGMIALCAMLPKCHALEHLELQRLKDFLAIKLKIIHRNLVFLQTMMSLMPVWRG